MKKKRVRNRAREGRVRSKERIEDRIRMNSEENLRWQTTRVLGSQRYEQSKRASSPKSQGYCPAEEARWGRRSCWRTRWGGVKESWRTR